MKIDQDYLRKMLEAFEASEGPVFYVSDFKAAALDHREDQFAFHLALLDDQEFVARDDGKLGFGLARAADGSSMWSLVRLRLTAQGHSFIEALRNKEVWATIKRDFKDVSIGTLVDVAKKLSEGYVKKKIDSLLNGERTFAGSNVKA
ncbi:MAG TPA: DUF2513 domain-containing protein [Roseiarcus sp.]|nr:DUF2513 domain-containing protein [Roseiarcus sp.]